MPCGIQLLALGRPAPRVAGEELERVSADGEDLLPHVEIARRSRQVAAQLQHGGSFHFSQYGADGMRTPAIWRFR